MEFNEFFSQNANEKKTLTDFQIEEGFGYLGSTPPSRMDFDYMFRRADNNLYLIYNKYLAKASIKDSLDAVKLAYQKLDNDYQKVAGTRQKIYDAENFYYMDYPTYQQQNTTNTQNTGNYTTDIQNMTSAIQTVSQEILDLVNRSYNNDISGLDALPAKEAQLQSLIDQLNNLSPSDSDLPGYLSKNKQVNVGDVFNVVGVPAMYKAFCSVAGTTDSSALTIDPSNIKDGYEFTYGTASFILYASFLSLPVAGNLDILATGFRITQDGFLINPLNGDTMQHRKLIFIDKINEEAEYATNRNTIIYNKNKNYLVKNGLSLSTQNYNNNYVDGIYKGDYSSYSGIGIASCNSEHIGYSTHLDEIMARHSHSITNLNCSFDESTAPLDKNTSHNHTLYQYSKLARGNNTLSHNNASYGLSRGDSTATKITKTFNFNTAVSPHRHQISSTTTDYSYNIPSDKSSSWYQENISFLGTEEFPESVALFFIAYV